MGTRRAVSWAALADNDTTAALPAAGEPASGSTRPRRHRMPNHKLQDFVQEEQWGSDVERGDVPGRSSGSGTALHKSRRRDQQKSASGTAFSPGKDKARGRGRGGGR